MYKKESKVVIKKEIIKEGGHAIEGASKIPKEQIDNTLKALERDFLIPQLNLSLDQCAVVGSTGKKDKSGDIDLAIPFTALNGNMDVDTFFHHAYVYLYDFYEKISTSFKCKLNLQYKQIHLGVPQYDTNNEKTNNLAQVDLMFGNVSYLKWACYSDPQKSAYESWVRNSLLASLAETKKIIKFTEEKYQVVLGLTFDNYSGLLSTVYTTNSDKELSQGKTLINIDLITDNPDELLSTLFDDQINSNNVLLAEDVIELLKSKGLNTKEFKQVFQKYMLDKHYNDVKILEVL